jgi:hypothetical protein
MATMGVARASGGSQRGQEVVTGGLQVGNREVTDVWRGTRSTLMISEKKEASGGRPEITSIENTEGGREGAVWRGLKEHIN